MWTDDAGYIFCTRVANFHCISVEYLVQLVRFWEVMVQKVQETFCDAGNDVLAIWWVKSGDVLLCFGLFFLVFVKFDLTEWYPLFSKAFSYSTFAELKISILDEFLESLWAFDIRNCLIIWGMVGGGINVQ